MASSDRQAALEQLHEEIRRCHHCGLCDAATHHVPGEGPADASIMFIGEGPGAEEEQQGRPFVGPSGQLLTRLLALAGLDREAVFITSVVKCRPPGNREPTLAELTACLEHTRAQIAILRPKVICTLGRVAAQALLDKSLSITKEHGRPRQVGDILYVPLYHPAAALHQQQLRETIEADMLRLRAVLETKLGKQAG